MVVDKLIEILESLGYPVFLQGSLLPDEPYPDSFFTYWNRSANGNSFYDNSENSIIWEFGIYFYSNDADLVYSMILEAKDILKSNGFICSGAGYSVMSDEVTHTGRGIDVIYRQ